MPAFASRENKLIYWKEVLVFLIFPGPKGALYCMLCVVYPTALNIFPCITMQAVQDSPTSEN